MIERARDVAIDMGDQFSLAVATVQEGRLHEDRQDYEKSLPYFSRGVEIFTELGARWELGDALAERGIAQRELGRLDEAERDLRRAIAISEELGERQLAGWTWRALAHVSERRGDHEVAEQHRADAPMWRSHAARTERRAPRGAYPTVRLIGTAASAIETGQFCLAPSAASRKPSASRPGTSPTTCSRTPVMPSPGWKSTSARVCSVVGGVPPLASALDSAIEKHDEWAAAISSSGLVRPFGSSVRDAHVTSNEPSPLDSRVTVPLPSVSGPCHSVAAKRVVAIVFLLPGRVDRA